MYYIKARINLYVSRLPHSYIKYDLENICKVPTSCFEWIKVLYAFSAIMLDAKEAKPSVLRSYLASS